MYSNFLAVRGLMSDRNLMLFNLTKEALPYEFSDFVIKKKLLIRIYRLEQCLTDFFAEFLLFPQKFMHVHL